MTFTGNINFDVESQTNNNLQIGSTVIPNVVYGAAFNKLGAPDTIIPAQTYVYVGTKDAVSYTHLGGKEPAKLMEALKAGGDELTSILQ